jgi:hypothetical protein
MNREKLLAKARNNPRGLRFTEICQLAEAFGWILDRQGGSQHIYLRQGVPGRVNLQPDRNRMAKEYQVRDLVKLIDEYGE